jgi:hypothetical protein
VQRTDKEGGGRNNQNSMPLFGRTDLTISQRAGVSGVLNVRHTQQATVVTVFAHLFSIVLERIRDNYREWKLVHFLQDLIPIIQWLPHYKWRHDIIGDLIAGITVAVMHIPQGKRPIQHHIT